MSWRPDWRDENLYPIDLSPEKFRWEFLRRNAEYQKDWDKYFPDFYEKNIQAYKNLPLPDGVKSWEDHFSNLAEMPNCREKYNIEYLLNPACNVKPTPFFIGMNQFFVNCADDITLSSEGIKRNTGKDPKDIFLYSFDLSKPIKSQLDKAKIDLERLQAELNGKPKGKQFLPKKWALYLRILDAKNLNIENKIIAGSLYSVAKGKNEAYYGKNRLTDDLDAARKLTNNVITQGWGK